MPRRNETTRHRLLTRGLAVFALLCLVSLSAGATPAAVDVSAESVPLGPMASVVRDPAADLTEQAVLERVARGHVQPATVANSFSFSSAAYWLVISLHNPTGATLPRLLVFEPTWLDDVRATLIAADGSRQQFLGGDRLDFAARTLPHRNINVELSLPPGASQLVVRVQTQDPFLVKMTLWERSAFHRDDSDLHTGIIYGVLGAMVLYNLILFVAIRERVYAAYVAYVLAFLACYTVYSGYAFPLLWPHAPVWANWAHSVFIYLFVWSGLYFAAQFLELKTRLPRVETLARWTRHAVVISFVVTAAIGGYRYQVISVIGWVILYAPFALLLGVLSFMGGNRAARYFLPATAAGFVGSTITGLAVAGLVPYNDYTFSAADVGMVIDAILLSIALAERLKLARADAEQARVWLLEAAQTHTRELEGVVAQRTQELREANAAKDRFIGVLAHDLRGPIRSLALFYNDIVRSPADFSDEILQLTRSTANSTNQLLEQLLTWARTQRGDVDFQPERFDLAPLLAQTQEFFAPQALAQGITLELAWPEPHAVYADRAMVHTVLRNLVANALKYTKTGGSVSAEVHRKAGRCQVSIRDTGIGLSDAQAQALFHPERRPSPLPGIHGETGTGFGLVLCRELVGHMGGTMGVHSEAGKGTTFWFTVPLHEATPEHVAAAHVTDGQLQILLAEDDPLTRQMTATMLRRLGHAVICAADGNEAVRRASAQRFDLILMDIDLPRLNGIDATRQLRRQGCAGKIVAWTSHSREEIARLGGAAADFDGYLEKPLAPTALGAELERLFPGYCSPTAIPASAGIQICRMGAA